MGHWRSILFVVTALGAAGGCFHPNIRDGGFFCSDAGACPEDFRCNPDDRRCYRGNGGPDVRTCTDAGPAVTPLCNEQPASGQACNPACQTGCGCSQRCAVTGTAHEVRCGVIGPKTLGQACNLAADDCGFGMVCLNECGDGGTVGRCLQFCRMDNDCSNGRRCLISIEGTPLMACQAPASTCNPVAATGCPTSALACYLDEVPNTKCECEGPKAGGATCALETECVAGFQCVSFSGQTLCRKVCAQQADCVGQTLCTKTVAGAPFGFCL